MSRLLRWSTRGNIPRFGPLNKVICRKDHLHPLRGSTSVTECPPVTSQFRSPVVGNVTRHVTTGLRRCNLSWHFDVDLPASTASVGDERGHVACVFSSRFAHITLLLRQLHWLREPERIDFKLAVLVYREQHRRTSSMNSTMRLILRPGDVYAPPRFRLPDVHACRPAHVWNSLPHHVTSAQSLTVFRSRLMTCLFSRSFP